MPERVKANPRDAGLLRGRCKDTVPQVAVVLRVPVSVGNTRSSSPGHSVAFRHARSSLTRAGESGTSGRPCRVLGSSSFPRTSASDADVWVAAVELEVAPLDREQLWKRGAQSRPGTETSVGGAWA